MIYPWKLVLWALAFLTVSSGHAIITEFLNIILTHELRGWNCEQCLQLCHFCPYYLWWLLLVFRFALKDSYPYRVKSMLDIIFFSCWMKLNKPLTFMVHKFCPMMNWSLAYSQNVIIQFTIFLVWVFRWWILQLIHQMYSTCPTGGCLTVQRHDFYPNF